MLAPLRRALVRQVRVDLQRPGQGRTAGPASDHALFPPDSVIWRVHGDVTSMMAGGIAALLTQMLHPQALGGVWDHSDVAFRHARAGCGGRRGSSPSPPTASATSAEAAIAKVRRIHGQVGGTLADGTRYRADDPHLLAWVHVAGAMHVPRRLAALRRAADERARPGPLFRRERRGRAACLARTRCRARGRGRAARSPSFRHELRADERSRDFRDLVLERAGAVACRSAGPEAADGSRGRPAAAVRARLHGLVARRSSAAGRARRDAWAGEHVALGLCGRELSLSVAARGARGNSPPNRMERSGACR